MPHHHPRYVTGGVHDGALDRRRAKGERKLDFEDLPKVLRGKHMLIEDTRKDYGEKRILCFGFFGGRMVVVGFVQRGEVKHVFSMRKANDREQKKINRRFSEQSGGG